jgi:hypothetical protein
MSFSTIKAWLIKYCNNSKIPGIFIILLLVSTYGSLYAQTGFHGSPGRHTVRPADIDDVLYNPGMGFTTMNAFNGDVEGHPRSTVAYWRFYWSDIEPENGRFNWDRIDEILKTARERGQKVGLGIMPVNGGPPQWYRDLGTRGWDYAPEMGGESWMPDHNDPSYLQYHGRMVRELGKRYDGHPDLDHIDIRSLGHWGEWHFAFVESRPEVEPQIRRALVDIYLESFTSTSLIMLIGSGDELAYALENGAGWRADCLGDLGRFSPHWNHMRDAYQQYLDAAGANDAWKHAPVHFESCGVMQVWADSGYDIEHIFNEALRWRVSVFNNKSSQVPPRWWSATEEFMKRMGYRFVINYLTLPTHVKAGESLKIESEWGNLGVAPVYMNYEVSFKLIGKGRRSESTIIKDPAYNVDIRNWLPGNHQMDLDLVIPAGLAPGRYNLAVALRDIQTGEVAIDLAIQGRDYHGWYILTEVEVE